MKIYNQPVGLIIDAPSAQAKSLGAPDIKTQLEKGDVPVEKIIKRSVLVPAKKGVAAKGIQTNGKQYVKTKLKDTNINPCDVAYQAAEALQGNITNLLCCDTLLRFNKLCVTQ